MCKEKSSQALTSSGHQTLSRLEEQINNLRSELVRSESEKSKFNLALQNEITTLSNEWRQVKESNEKKISDFESKRIGGFSKQQKFQ